MEKGLETEREQLEKLNSRLKSVNEALTKDSEEAFERSSKLTSENTNLEDKNRSINRQLQSATEMILDLADEKTQRETELKAIKVEVGQARIELGEVREAKEDATTDTAVLQTEANALQTKIVELDSQLVAHKAITENNIRNINERLQKAINMLRETMAKDQDIRKSWQVQLADLERRESVVKKREMKLGDVESRVQEYENFMKL